MDTLVNAGLPAGKRQMLVSVSGVSMGYWSTKTGGEVSAAVSDVFDGGALEPAKLAAPATTKNVVLSRPYKIARDQPVLKRLAGLVGRWRTTVTVQDTDPDLVPIGKPTVYPDALLVRVQPPDHDASSGDPGMFEIEFAVPRTI